MSEVPLQGQRTLFVTNFASHYRVPVFESLARDGRVRFVFFSEGGESFWQAHLGISEVRVDSKVLLGWEILPKLRINVPFAREVFSSSYDVIVMGTNGRFELPTAWLASRMRHKPFVLWTGLWEHPSSRFHRLTRPLLRSIYRRAEAIVVYGEHVKRFVVSEGAVADKVFVAENSVANDEFLRESDSAAVSALRARVTDGRDGPVVLAVSRLVPQKGLDYLVRAIGALGPGAPALMVAGTGRYGAELEALAAEFGVRLCLLGGIAQSEMIEVYDAADIFVMPSISTPEVKETWGLACNEAMLRGVPVIATDAVGSAAGGLVVDGVTGLVVPERDEYALTEAISRLVANADERRRLADGAIMRVAQATPERMADAFRSAIDYASARR